MTEPFEAVAVLPQGLEVEGAAELSVLGALNVRPLRRAASFRTDGAGFLRLHLRARLPFRLLRQLATFPCAGPRELYGGVQAAADWDRWLPPSSSFRVEVSGSAPGLSHSHYSALQVKNALVDLQRQRWGERSSIDLDNPDLALHLHLGGGRAALSVEGSSSSLHRRGYRAALGLAPLKENLAAGLIALTGWDGTVPLADPLCGSGTLLIEAACWALGRAPGLLEQAGGVPRARSFAFERWPDFDPVSWRDELAAAIALRRDTLADGSAPAPIVGWERDPTVLEQARTNAQAAGVAPWLKLCQGDARAFVPPERPGVLVCNPPYGERLGAEDDLEALYADLGQVLKERCSGWSLWLLSGNPTLTGALRMKARRKVPVSNGGLDCRWLHYEIR
ncbi:class I SAM-dependent RNA methyltransferase [Cyanobium sp. Morenito 9A2]|uniref:THUMP domain-containing class I SAM-dependent RNA methyltransferase n=1 Tax=Cyanobium sp. Morenito 9A2 TaxID=2823718 RepID=UPI0020CFE561|nr:THUMP domain-containing protein [Cyanobium sp. Morenito 9A2]MCP9850882.1 class I SAM-dependent RNA methyltransferase [Cyanobium sp. Morenito 9A2]